MGGEAVQVGRDGVKQSSDVLAPKERRSCSTLLSWLCFGQLRVRATVVADMSRLDVLHGFHHSKVPMCQRRRLR